MSVKVLYCPYCGSKLLSESASFCQSCGKQIPECNLKTHTKADESSEQERSGGKDPLFDDAVQLAVEKGQLSTSILQRNLRLGYARAERLMDQLELEKIIGPYEGASPRKVLIPHNEPEDDAPQDKTELVSQQSEATFHPPAESVQKLIYAQAKPNKKKPRSRVSIYELDYLDGHDFEMVCAKILQSNGFSDVEVTQASGDYGIDILARKSGVRYAIQCKCYSSPVGNHAVQEAYSGAAYYGGGIPVVMTNQTFTTAAIKTASAIGVELWGRDKLERMLSAYNQTPMWKMVCLGILRFLFADIPSGLATILTVLSVYRNTAENPTLLTFGLPWIIVSVVGIWLFLNFILRWLLRRFIRK